MSTSEAIAHFVPKEILDAAAALPQDERDRVCQGDLSTLYTLTKLKPAAKLVGMTSGRWTADSIHVLESYSVGISQLATAALIRGDDAQKTLLIKTLAKWAKANAYLQTPSCYHNTCQGEWTSKRGTEASTFSDSDAANDHIMPTAFAYYLTLRDYKPVELAEDHAAIAKWLGRWEKRLPDKSRTLPPDIFFGFGLNWQLSANLVFDLVEKGDARFAERVKAVSALVDGLILPDGSLKNRTTRGSRATWYHFASLNELMIGLEIFKANGVDLYPSLAPRIEKSVQIFLDAMDDMANHRNDPDHLNSIYKWAKADYQSAGDPRTQEFGPLANESLDYGSSWMFIYLHRFPDTENAKRLRAQLHGLKYLPQSDQAVGFNFGCLYRLADPDLLAQEERRQAPVSEAELTSLEAVLENPDAPLPAKPTTIGSLSLSENDMNIEADAFSVILKGVVMDGKDLGTISADIYANYWPPAAGKSLKSLSALRVVAQTYTLDDTSRKNDFAPCGDMAANGGTIRLHYGRETNLNTCILNKLSDPDRDVWNAIYQDMPAWIETAAAGGDPIAKKLLTMFKKKMAEKSD